VLEAKRGRIERVYKVEEWENRKYGHIQKDVKRGD